MNETKRFVVGVVGAGRISDIYLKNMIERFNDLLEVRYISSKSMDSARKKAKQYNLIALTYDELVEKKEVDIIVNLTPTFAHYELVKKALLHVKHVYSEKILTDSFETTKELVDLAKKRNLYLGVAPDTILGSAVVTAKKLIEEGIIGEVNSFTFVGNRNNDFLLSVIPNSSKKGGGVVLDFSIYHVASFVSLFGPIKRVSSFARTRYKTHVGIVEGVDTFNKEFETPNESIVNAIFEMENGITGSLNINCESLLANYSQFAIYGKKGILILGDPDHFGDDVLLIKENMSWNRDSKPIVIKPLNPYKENSRGVGIYNMAKAIKGEDSFFCNSELAYHLSEVLFKIKESGMKGEFINISSTYKNKEVKSKDVGIKKLAHISYQTKDYLRMKKFYKDVLGMKEIFETKINDLYLHVSNNISKKREMSDSDQKFLDRLAKYKDETWLSYFKLGEREFVELFNDIKGYTKASEDFKDRKDHYGYKKMNFEVEDIYLIKERCLQNDVKIINDIHEDSSNSLELTVLDYDSNIVEFTSYNKKEKEQLGIKEDIASMSSVKAITQVAFDVDKDVDMFMFYKSSLNLRHALRKTYNDLLSVLERSDAPKEFIEKVRRKKNDTWIDYFEVGPHQYIELFYPLDRKEENLDISNYYGYQHISIEVEDIFKAYNALVENGVEPLTEIKKGCDKAYQFWIQDPDGNRIELHQYLEDSNQVKYN